jgi:hypothetical protein
VTIREWLETDEHLIHCWAHSEGFTESCCILKLPTEVLDMEMRDREFEREQAQFMAEARHQAEVDHQ